MFAPLSSVRFSMIAWTSVFSVGNRVLDAQHQNLVEIINQIYAGLSTSEEATLRHARLHALIDAAKGHFESENRILGEILSDAAKTRTAVKTLSKAAIGAHVQSHSKALIQLQSIIQMIEGAGRSEALKYCEELIAWFIDHSVKHDADLKTVFQAM